MLGYMTMYCADKIFQEYSGKDDRVPKGEPKYERALREVERFTNFRAVNSKVPGAAMIALEKPVDYYGTFAVVKCGTVIGDALQFTLSRNFQMREFINKGVSCLFVVTECGMERIVYYIEPVTIKIVSRTHKRIDICHVPLDVVVEIGRSDLSEEIAGLTI